MKQVLFFIALIGVYHVSFSMEDSCSICLENLNEARNMRLGCAHCYHETCWIEWEDLEKMRIVKFASAGVERSQISYVSCPSCRQPFDRSKVIYAQRNIWRSMLSGLVGRFRSLKREMVVDHSD